MPDDHPIPIGPTGQPGSGTGDTGPTASECYCRIMMSPTGPTGLQGPTGPNPSAGLNSEWLSL